MQANDSGKKSANVQKPNKKISIENLDMVSRIQCFAKEYEKEIRAERRQKEKEYREKNKK